MKKGILVIDLRKVGLVVLGLVLILVSLVPMGVAYVNRDILGGFLMSQYAHMRAGEEIRFDPGYYYDNAWMDWGITHNSKWMLDWTLKIMPALVYEKASTHPGMYPSSVGFVPYIGVRSYRVAGFAEPDYFAVWLNDRYVLDEEWGDERAALETLVHELIHLQGGGYLMGDSSRFEPKTAAATLEILAGMCNYGSEVSCKAFWMDVEGFARVSLKQDLTKRDMGWVYNVIANLVWRDAEDERAAAKSDRYWAENAENLAYIYQAYYETPWGYVLDGVLRDVKLDTGLNVPVPGEWWKSYVLGMPFDDTKDLFGGMAWLLRIVYD